MFLGLRRMVGVFVFTLLALPAATLAQPFLDTPYSEQIPTLETVIGHAPGEEITTSAETLQYFEALQAAAPDRMTIVQYATSWQGRPLYYAIIGSPENIARLDEIKADLGRLGSGEDIDGGDLTAIVERTPAVSWLSYGVHGDEISPTDSAIFMAYHLLAAVGDPTVDQIMANTLTIIDPDQNPDGRERFVQSFESARGLEPMADRYAAEHDQPWPRGRFNHYLFDLNRDWFAITQPETQGKVRAVLEWHPVVFVDSHEMGGDNTYFFPPSADPFNPYITEEQREKQRQFGRNHAEWFDRMGIAYFTREIFDAFYPGYGDMWPTLNGAVAKTFEQGSARGLRFTRRDGSELTFREGVKNNFIASLSTAEVVAENKDRFLREYAEYRSDTVEEGRNSRQRYFVIDLSVRRWQAETLARRLEAQGIEVARLPGQRELCREEYPEGVLVVDRAQPNGKLISTLLEEDTPLPPEFVIEQESRRDRGLDHQLYDVTAWSLPLMDGLKATTCRRVGLTRADRIEADEPIAPILGRDGTFGYAVPWSDTGQAKLVVAALKAGLKARTTDTSFTIDARTFDTGTAVFSASDNPDTLTDTLNALATEIGAEIVPMTSSWVDDGPNFGSSAFASLKMPQVALAWGDGTSPTQVGAARFIIERDLGIPVAPIRVDTLQSADLSLYDVLVLPGESFDFNEELGSGGEAALTSFVRGGGVLVGFGSAMDTLISEDVGLLSTTEENAFSETSGDDASGGDVNEGLRLTDGEAYAELIADAGASPEDVPGALVNLEVDTAHWLSAGYDSAIALVSGRQIYRPLNAADGANVFRFADAENLLASGYLWEENRLQLAYKPYVMVERTGDGITIGFTQNPTTRAYLNGLTLLVANAVVLGPARTQ